MANNLSVGISLLSQDIASNTSVIRVAVVAIFQYYASSQVGSTAYVTIDGVSTSFGAPAYNVGNGGSVHIGTFDRTITHNADGTRSVGASASWSPPYVYPAGLTFSGSASTGLTTIPRASTFSISGSTLGSAVTVAISRASGSFTHTVRYQFGSIVREYTGQATSCSFTPPLSDASQIPNTTSGVGSITVYTYSGGTHIGTNSSTFTLNLPASVVPSFSTFSISRVDNGVPSAWGIYVQGISKATLVISGESGIYGSTISSFSITGGGFSGAKTLTTGALSAGSITFTGTISDSRGRTASKTQTITVYSNNPPSLTLKVARCNSAGVETNDGTYVKVTPTYLCASVNGKNFISTKTFSIIGTSYSNTTCVSGSFIVLGAGAIAISKSYEVSGEVKDALGQSSGAIKVIISSSSVPINLNEQGVAFGGYYDTNVGGCIQIKEETGKMTSCPFPIGFVMSNTLSTFNPNTFYKGTTWTRYAQGSVLVGVDEAQTEFATANKVGGSKYIQDHNHTTVKQGWNAQLFARITNTAGESQAIFSDAYDTSKNLTGNVNGKVGDSGNLQPYITTYMWVRTA